MNARLLVDLGVEHGLTVSACLRGVGVGVEELRSPAAELSRRQEFKIVENLLEELGDPPGLGVLAGARLRLLAFGPLGFAMLTSETVGDALAKGFRFIDLGYGLSDVRLRPGDRETRVEATVSDLPENIARFAVEHDFAGVVTGVGDALGLSLQVVRLAFRYPAPLGRADVFHRVFGVEPRFDAAANVMTFDRDVMSEPLPQADPQASMLAEIRCRDLLSSRSRTQAFADHVRAILVEQPRFTAGIADVALQLNVSERTLRRRLAAENTSFRHILARVQDRVADELLDAGLSVGEIARRLGYSETASFTHAYTARTGAAPSARRKSASDSGHDPVRLHLA